MQHQLVVTPNQLVNLVQMSKWEMKKMNPWKQKFPVSEYIQRIQRAERNKYMKIVGMLFTGIGVLLVSKFVVLGDNIKLNRWRKKKENRQTQWWLFIPFS